MTPSEAIIIDSLRSLIIQRKKPMSAEELHAAYERKTGRKIPELQIKVLLCNKKYFEFIKVNSNTKYYKIRDDVSTAPLMPRNRPTLTKQKDRLTSKTLPPETSTDDVIAKKIWKMLHGRPGGVFMDHLVSEYAKHYNLSLPAVWNSKVNEYRVEYFRFEMNPFGQNICYAIERARYSAVCSRFHEAHEAIMSEEISYPIDTSPDIDIAKRVRKMIQKKPAGVLMQHIADMYKETYKLSLRDTSILKQYEGYGFRFENSELVGDIIFAIDIATCQTIAEFEFPRTDRFWIVYCTEAISPSEIYVRLLADVDRDDYDAAFNDMLITIEKTEHEHVKDEIKLNYIYLASEGEWWYRVKTVKFEGDKVLCFLIDDGDCRSFARKDIYICKPEYLTVPPHAIKIALHPTEKFEGVEIDQQELRNALVGITFFAYVKGDIEKDKPIAMQLLEKKDKMYHDMSLKFIDFDPNPMMPFE